MASGSGVSSGRTIPHGNVNFGDAQVSEGGAIQVHGKPVDVTTPEGAAVLRGAVSPEELAAIKGMLQLKEVSTPKGPVLVPDDSYKRVDTSALRRQLGPSSTTQGQSQLDQEIGAFFQAQGVANPYNANTTPKLYGEVKGTPEFGPATQALSSYFSNPTAANQAEFVKYMKNLAAANPHGNVMELLFIVFRESIEQTNEDKKYFLLKLQDYNKMAEELGKYLSSLVDVSRDLGAQAAGAKYPEMEMTSSPVTVKQFDLTTLNSQGNLVETKSESKPLDRAGLNDTIKEVESMQETVRNRRQMASTAFQNFDQKSNQLYNLMASVMKTMNEMRSGTIRNFL
jgi:hypothetical protein